MTALLSVGLVGDRGAWGRQAGVVADDFSVVGGVEQAFGVAVGVNRTLGEDDVAGRGDLDYLIVVLVADKRVAVVQAHGAGGKGHHLAVWALISGKHEKQGAGGGDLDNAAVVGVGDQGVAVGQAAGERGAVEQR